MIDLADFGLTPRVLDAFHALSRPDCLLARVLSSPGGRWRVITPHGERFAEPTGRFLHAATSPDALPTVGDWLAVAPRPGEDRADVVALLPRTTLLARKVADRAIASQPLVANLDLVLLACALDLDWNPRRLERALALAWDAGAQPVVVLTKTDVAPDVAARVAETEAVAVGAPVVAVSARTGAGLDAVRAALPARTTSALLGSSGVGKSTLVNALLGREAQATLEVRAHDHRGRHATTVREMFALPWGALLVDTPGLREIAAFTDEDAVDAAFDDVTRLAAACRFRDCAHASEPACAVHAAIERGELAAARLDDYRRLRREQAWLARKEDPRAARAERERWKAIGRAGTAAMRAKGKDPRR